MPDVLKISLWVGLTAVALGVVCLGVIAWNNAGSKNLPLAASALVAAAALFATQLYFELQPKTETDVFAAELTIDHATPQIRLWSYPKHPDTAVWRLNAETRASAYLAQHDRSRFDSDGARLNYDLLLYSFLAFLGAEQFDWQRKRTALHGATSGTLIQSQRISKDDECSSFSAAQLEEMLVAAGNAFGRVPLTIFGDKLCLPPKSALKVTSHGLEIRTPYCIVSFILEPTGSLSNMEPGSGGKTPQMKNGKTQFETRLTGIRSVVEFSGIRAQSPQMGKYVEWSGRLVRGARLWFEGRTEPTN
jgi:hypothetical protein